jgi:hypothetical protein
MLLFGNPEVTPEPRTNWDDTETLSKQGLGCFIVIIKTVFIAHNCLVFHDELEYYFIISSFT